MSRQYARIPFEEAKCWIPNSSTHLRGTLGRLCNKGHLWCSLCHVRLQGCLLNLLRSCGNCLHCTMWSAWWISKGFTFLLKKPKKKNVIHNISHSVRNLLNVRFDMTHNMVTLLKCLHQCLLQEEVNVMDTTASASVGQQNESDEQSCQVLLPVSG